MQLERTAEKIALLLESKSIILIEDVPLYSYGLSLLLSSAGTLFSVLFLSILCGRFFPAVTFLLFFIPLRMYSGGYHTSTFLRCYLTFMALFASFLFLLFLIPEKSAVPCILFCLSVSVFLITRYAPVTHPNAPICPEDVPTYRMKSRRFLLLGVCCALVLGALSLFWSQLVVYGEAATLGLLYASALTGVGAWQQIHSKGGNKHENGL